MDYLQMANDPQSVNTFDDMMKLQVLKLLFVHREDVFAKHYKEKGIWFPMKERESGKFIPLENYALTHHLQGKHRMGVYSTQLDNSVKWIVADFDDNANAYDHCIALRDKLEEYSIPSYVERSNSGKGYHLWVFFEAPVLAILARKMMLVALLEANIPITGKVEKGSTQSRSMDRLIPTQGRLPQGGLGNLICLPLQGEAVRNGNTMFLRNQSEPFVSQWAYLYHIAWYGRVKEISEGFQTLINADIDLTDSMPSEQEFYGDSSEDQLDNLQDCEAIIQSQINPNQFGNFTWVGILSNIAAFGSRGRELAHDVSRGYDMVMAKNDPNAVYSEEETDRAFFHKVDFVQLGGHPMSCKRIAEEGWECPRLHECHYQYIAKYKIDPINEESFKDTEHSIKESYRYYGIDDINDTFIFKVMNTNNYLVKREDKWYPDGVWMHGQFTKYEKISRYDIAKIALGEPMMIESYDQSGMTKWATIGFDQEEYADKLIQSDETLYKEFNSTTETWRVWAFSERKQGAISMMSRLLDAAEKLGLPRTADEYMIPQWVVAPFIGGSKWDGNNNIEALYKI
jgi:hypothetical protein